LEKRPTYSPNIEAWVITSEKKFTPDEFFSLPYDKNDLQIEFSVLMFRGAEQMKIAYKINDAHWINLENNTRQINLSSLSPGKYDLTIRAYLQSGNQLHFTKNISFEVKKPFWLTYWAVALYILLFFSAAFAFFKYRIKRLEEKSKADAQKIYLEQQLQKSLLTSIKAQMNPHFIFNALNTIQSYIYLNEKQQASTYLVKFSELTRMILEMSNYETISLADEIKTLKLYLELEAMRFEDTLIFEINVAENIKTEMCKIPSMLIQPYVENAVKHGLLHKKDDRRVSVDFFIEDNLLNVVIDDNGIGREKSKQINDARKNKPQSFATIANQKRLELLNLGLNVNIGIEIIDKYDEQNMPSGTKVILKIPLKTT
jgi:two-component sensor histidine kinase